MKEEHCIRMGLHRWSTLPAGYEKLSYWEKIQGGDVQKMSDECYAEYPNNGLLIKLGEWVGSGDWYRKIMVDNGG